MEMCLTEFAEEGTKVEPDKIQMASPGWIDLAQLWSWEAHECNNQNIGGEYLLNWKTIWQ